MRSQPLFLTLTLATLTCTTERGVTSATYHACRQAGGFYAQGFAFTRPPFRGCVPLDVTVGGPAQVRHVTLSLFAGLCAT